MSNDRPHRRLTDEELIAAINAKEREREFWRRRVQPFKDDAHRGIDETVRLAKVAVDRALAENLLDLASEAHWPVVPHIADLWVLSHDPTIAARWHELVDRAGPSTFDARSRADYDAGRAKIDADLLDLKREERLRVLDAERDRIERQAVTQ